MTRQRRNTGINMNNFTGAVSDHPAVIQTEVNDTRSPPRVTVVLSASEIPDGVHDVLNRFNATIEEIGRAHV